MSLFQWAAFVFCSLVAIAHASQGNPLDVNAGLLAGMWVGYWIRGKQQ